MVGKCKITLFHIDPTFVYDHEFLGAWVCESFFFAGKGGTGKTSVAAATGISMAEILKKSK
jgi:DNA replication protein DnaC